MRATVALLVALLALTAAAALAATRSAPRVVARIATGQAPCSEAGGFGAVWVGNYGSSDVARIDPKTNRVTRRIPVGTSPCGIGIGAGAVWVDGWGTGYVERIDPRKLKVTKRVRVAAGNTLWDVTFGGGAVWGTDYTGGVVIRVDPRTMRVVKRIKVGGSAVEPALRRRFALGRLADRHVDLPDRPGHERGDDDRRRPPEPRLAGGLDQRRLGREPARQLGVSDRSRHEHGRGHGHGRPASGATRRSLRAGLVFVPLKGENKVAWIDPATNTLGGKLPSGPGPFPAAEAFGDIWVPDNLGTQVVRIRPS